MAPVSVAHRPALFRTLASAKHIDPVNLLVACMLYVATVAGLHVVGKVIDSTVAAECCEKTHL
jgi:hypothetical protein